MIVTETDGVVGVEEGGGGGGGAAGGSGISWTNAFGLLVGKNLGE